MFSFLIYVYGLILRATSESFCKIWPNFDVDLIFNIFCGQEGLARVTNIPEFQSYGFEFEWAKWCVWAPDFLTWNLAIVQNNWLLGLSIYTFGVSQKVDVYFSNISKYQKGEITLKNHLDVFSVKEDVFGYLFSCFWYIRKKYNCSGKHFYIWEVGAGVVEMGAIGCDGRGWGLDEENTINVECRLWNLF